MEIDLDTWVISDTHFGHYNMIRLENRPLNFNEKMFSNWKKAVGDGQPILHLGDIAIWFGPLREMWLDVVTDLPGDRFLIRGNHDELEREAYEWYGWTVLDPFIAEVEGINILFSHEPQVQDKEWWVNIHGHVHGNMHHSDDYEFDWSGPEYINMSVEVRDYRPWRLRDILGR
jgi:calcineurin-like phosphoesterase family protein